MSQSSCSGRGLIQVFWLAVAAAAAAGAARFEDEPAAPPPDEVRAFLDGVRSRYEIPYLNGLESFSATLELASVQNERFDSLREGVAITYGWETAGGEKVELEGVPAQFRKSIRDPLRGLWKDIAGGCVFPDIDPDLGAGSLSLSGTAEGIAIVSAPPEGVTRSVLFDPETSLVLKATISGENLSAEIAVTYITEDGLLRLAGKTVTVSGESGEIMDGSYVYSGFRNLGGFVLPTLVTLQSGDFEAVLKLKYTAVNGAEPQAGAVDPARVKEQVREFEAEYSRLSTPEKKDAMAKLAESGHELAAAAIAKKGLKDSDAAVRREAADLLGRMECREAVPHLIKAMKPNEDELEVYQALITALGDLGDPRAVDALSSDLWNQKENASAIQVARMKIDALGRIRSKKSVEALIDLMYVAGPAAMNRLSGSLARSLQKLTGQELGWDRDQWKDWWKKNKSRFKLEEDR